MPLMISEVVAQITALHRERAWLIIDSVSKSDQITIADFLADADGSGKFDEAIQRLRPFLKSTIMSAIVIDLYHGMRITPRRL